MILLGFFSKSTVSNNYFTLSNAKLGPDPDLGPNCLLSSTAHQKWQLSYSEESGHFTYLRLNAFCDSLTPSYQSPQNFLLVTSAFIWKKNDGYKCVFFNQLWLILLVYIFAKTLVRCAHGGTQTGGWDTLGGRGVLIPLPLENLKCLTLSFHIALSIRTPSPPHTWKSLPPTPLLKNVLP